MNHIDAAALASNPLVREYKLTLGYSVEFSFGSGLEARWSPDVPRINNARPRAKLRRSYEDARRSFLQELAASIGGNVAVIDTDGQSEVVMKPVSH